MRALLIAVVLVAGASGTAEARRGGGIVIVNTGDAIEHIRDLDPEKSALVGYRKLGYRYELFGVFWIDFWRSGGEFVVYEGSTYAPLTDEELEVLGGASVPWRYHFPEGLLIVLGLIELAIISRTRRPMKVTLGIAGFLTLVSIAFFFKGLTWEFLIPLFLALHHFLACYSAHKRAADEAIAEASLPKARPSQQQTAVGANESGRFKAASSSGAHAPITESGRHSRPSMSPTTDSGRHSRPSDSVPSRPSQPIVVQRAITAPTVVPLKPDNSVDGPKLLR